MKEKNKGITLIKLIFIILIIAIIIMTFLFTYFEKITEISDIAYKTITKQINIENEIQENEKLMGITDVAGEGIIINILDGKDLIHQEDLVIMIDELKNAGSQAISINDQRIINSTYLYCDGGVILIDGIKIGNPFTIKAIGDTETIYGSITRNKGYIQTLKDDGLEVDVEKSENVNISKTNKDISEMYDNTKNRITRLYQSNNITGKSQISGKGIEITIQENSVKLTALSFLQIINDLNSADVKAISINEQRITNMTDIVDISKTYVLINSVPVQGEYKIKAIGNQDEIIEILNLNNSYINKIISKGNNVEIKEENNVKIDKYVQKRDQNKMLVDYLF